MSAQIIDGKAVAAQVTAGVKARVEALKAKGVTVGLAVILAGEDPASLCQVPYYHLLCSSHHVPYAH